MYASNTKPMLEKQLVARGISNAEILDAFAKVPREKFVPKELSRHAFDDSPLPIGEGQTISQPYVVALMVEALALQGQERVLDVGTGSGYAAAILSRLGRDVISIERVEVLATRAKDLLDKLGYDNVHVHHGDGTLGWPKSAPYDAIAIAAAAPEIPKALLSQLAPLGRLVMPLGLASDQVLTLVVHEANGNFRRESLGPVRFVPLIGEQGVRE